MNKYLPQQPSSREIGITPTKWSYYGLQQQVSPYIYPAYLRYPETFWISPTNKISRIFSGCHYLEKPPKELLEHIRDAL